MASNRNIAYFFRNLSRRHRLSLHDQHNESEVWYVFISPLKVIAVTIALLLILFILILTLVAYTPILNLIPGYSGNKQREEMIQNIPRVDSIEQSLLDIEAWGYDVALIMEGKTPVVRDVTQRGDSVAITKPELVLPNAEDSLLRSQIEGGGPYSLRQGRRSSNEFDMQTPVRGVVASHFSPKDGQFGVGVVTAVSQQVLAIMEGTVTLSVWTPDDGYLIEIQHTDNLLSIYKHISQALVEPGTRVRKGEAIGSTGDSLPTEGNKGLFELEIWQNGNPINPENYIVF